MPNTKSAKKALRQSKKRNSLNTLYKKRVKIFIKKIHELVAKKQVEKAKKILPKTYKALDKAAKAGIIKKKTANRKKSRLTKSINLINTSTKTT